MTKDTPGEGLDPAVADQIIGQIEERFPNWRSYRDLIDCIDCTLHDLRSASALSRATEAVAYQWRWRYPEEHWQPWNDGKLPENPYATFGSSRSGRELEFEERPLYATPPALALIEEMESFLMRINQLASPNPTRTFDAAVRDSDYITDYARSALAAIKRFKEGA